MRAIRIAKTGGRDVLQLVHDQAIPKPSAKQVLVKNKFAGINFIDTYFREGLYSHELPMTLGKEAAGEVVEVGPQSKFAKGDRVVYSASAGAYAEYTIVDTTAIARIPDEVSYDVAAASFIQGLTAITLVEETYKVQKGDYVLVHAAAGGMGQWLTQILNSMGAIVIATASSEAKLRIAKNNGAHHLIDYTKEDVVERLKAIRGTGVDVVYDGVGKSTFDISLACLKRKGFLASYGNAYDPIKLFHSDHTE